MTTIRRTDKDYEQKQWSGDDEALWEAEIDHQTIMCKPRKGSQGQRRRGKLFRLLDQNFIG